MTLAQQDADRRGFGHRAALGQRQRRHLAERADLQELRIRSLRLGHVDPFIGHIGQRECRFGDEAAAAGARIELVHEFLRQPAERRLAEL